MKRYKQSIIGEVGWRGLNSIPSLPQSVCLSVESVSGGGGGALLVQAHGRTLVHAHVGVAQQAAGLALDALGVQSMQLLGGHLQVGPHLRTGWHLGDVEAVLPSCRTTDICIRTSMYQVDWISLWPTAFIQVTGEHTLLWYIYFFLFNFKSYPWVLQWEHCLQVFKVIESAWQFLVKTSFIPLKHKRATSIKSALTYHHGLPCCRRRARRSLRRRTWRRPRSDWSQCRARQRAPSSGEGRCPAAPFPLGAPWGQTACSAGGPSFSGGGEPGAMQADTHMHTITHRQLVLATYFCSAFTKISNVSEKFLPNKNI